jgi:hypothetical protein
LKRPRLNWLLDFQAISKMLRPAASVQGNLSGQAGDSKANRVLAFFFDTRQ